MEPKKRHQDRSAKKSRGVVRRPPNGRRQPGKLNARGTPAAPATPDANVLCLVGSGIVSWCAYAAITYLSTRFHYESVFVDRPILAVLALFAVAFAAWLVAIRVVMRSSSGTARLMPVIFGAAIAFRAMMLVSYPIQEIDIYRYMWDGAVCTTGVSPFRFAPQQVRDGHVETATDDDLRALLRMRDQHPAIAATLHRVHFGHLPTIYPPVSQAVFAAATLVTPSSGSVHARLIVMKAAFVLFDLATMWLVAAILRMVGRRPELCLIYGWCPLLMKEVANSGHLDAIAVFLATLVVFLVVRWFADPQSSHQAPSPSASLFRSALVGGVLALAVGAKLYPIVLSPVLFIWLLRRRGITRAFAFGGTLSVVSLICLWPLLPGAAPSRDPIADGPPVPVPIASVSDSSQGLQTFLRSWEMNDFLFLIVVENVKPPSDAPPAWFAIVPGDVRVRWTAWLSERLALPLHEVPFLVARCLTAIAYAGVLVWLVRRVWRSHDALILLESLFLSVAWFWLLCPTQNPWYWTWALPLLPFARGRAWLVMSGLVFLYYLRFWFSYHLSTTPVAGTPYRGHVFFDLVVTWIEFAPWLACLAIAGWRRTQLQRSPRATSAS